jgi:hypothetical protein
MATTINFGEWVPDQPGVSGNLTEAKNVYPIATGYAPFPLAVDYSAAASETLNNVVAGKSGATTQIFAGGTTKLFKFDQSDLSLDDVSKAGGYATPTGDRWNFTQFGGVLLAANNEEKIQAWTIGTSTAWDDVSASAPVAKYLTVVRDFVVAANIGAGTYPTRVQWSDINDETDWTSGPTSQSDYQDIADGGDIRAITGGEFGLVLTEKAIIRMSYVGSPFFFQFDTISRNLGCFEQNSVAQYGGTTYFLSDDGFYSCDGQNVVPIGAEKVDRFFFNDANIGQIAEISTAVDPIRALVLWCYRNAEGGQSILAYHWQIKRWSYGTTTADRIASGMTAAITLEGLDAFGTVDSITTSWDDRTWSGGDLLLAGTDGAKIVTFTGANATASITTGDINAGNVTMLSMARPIVDNGSATVSVASRNVLSANPTFGSAVATNSDGRSPQRSVGRYHRIRVAPSGNWTAATGVEVDLSNAGSR